MSKSGAGTSLFLDSGGGWLRNVTSRNDCIILENPKLHISSKSGEVTITESNRDVAISTINALHILEEYLNEGYMATGYIGYEYARYADNGFTPVKGKDGYEYPDMYFMLYENEGYASTQIKEIYNALTTPVTGKNLSPGIKTNKSPSLSANMTPGSYLDMVKSVKTYIAQGDIYQVNLSQRFYTSFRSSPLSYFLKYYDTQQVPYASYMDFGGFQLLSGSMELFLERKGTKIITNPIKGTVKRGVNKEDDILKKTYLISSEKERAENLMIVDLMRNDLGKICKHGSVKVNRLFDIESYSTLHQMVSEVQGELKEDISLSEIINKVFPPGSVTGAPKTRTLEIIDEIEPHYRGPYCGAIGIFYPGGEFTLSVAIRVMTTHSGQSTFWVGGGIVWDSDPQKEYDETILKSKAIRNAMCTVEQS